MAFTSIVIIVGVPYVFYYVGMFIYDLFIKKDPAEFMPKPKDVEIDISDEAGQFKPIAVEKSEPKQPSVTAQSTSSHTPEEIVTAHPIADGENQHHHLHPQLLHSGQTMLSPMARPQKTLVHVQPMQKHRNA